MYWHYVPLTVKLRLSSVILVAVEREAALRDPQARQVLRQDPRRDRMVVIITNPQEVHHSANHRQMVDHRQAAVEVLATFSRK